MTHEQELRQYVKKRDGRRIGLLVAIKVGDQVFITGSKARSGERFDPKEGMTHALNRFNKRDRKKIILPASLDAATEEFVKRCRRYFKNAKIVRPQFDSFRKN